LVTAPGQSRQNHEVLHGRRSLAALPWPEPRRFPAVSTRILGFTVKSKDTEEPPRPKLTPTERKWGAEIEAIGKLVGDSEDAENSASDRTNALARRVFDVRKNAYKPRFQRYLNKLKFKLRTSTANPLLMLVDLTHGRLEPAKRTREGQLQAAALHFHRKPSELRAGEGGEKQAVKAWKEEIGWIKPRREPEPPQNTPVIIDGDLPDDGLHDGRSYIAIFTLISRSDMSLHLGAYLDADDPRVASIVKELQELARETADA